MSAPMKIPVAAAQRIAKAQGYDQVIIYARRVGEPGQEWVTAYGKDKAHCEAAARIGDAIGRRVVAPLEELRTALHAAVHALRSYEFGNGSPDLAKSIADAGEAVLAGQLTTAEKANG